MAPIALELSPSMLAGVGVLIAATTIVGFVATALMCGCGGKKEKADEMPPADGNKAAPPTPETPKESEPMPDAAPPSEQPQEKSKKSEKAAPEKSKSEVPRDASVMMKDAGDLQLMSKMEGPRGDQSIKGRSGAAKGDQPSLMLTGQSMMGKAAPSTKSAKPSDKSAVQKDKSVSVANKSVIGPASTKSKTINL